MCEFNHAVFEKEAPSGHSPRKNTCSKYICLTGSEPYDFLDIYRIDKEIRRDMKGMSESEQEIYLKEYTGWTDEHVDDNPWPEFDPDSEPFVTY